MLSLRDGRLVVPELRYGCTVVIGKDKAGIEGIVQLEETTTGERTTVRIPLPAANPDGKARKLRGATLTASWTPRKAGTYQGYLAYRATRLYHDGEPFLEPENVPAGYSGNTPANLFLKSQPVMKRRYEDRLRRVAVRVQ